MDIGILHLLSAFIFSLYAFLFKKSWIDYLFILIILFIMFSWTFYNGECLITYYIKLNTEPDYIAGTNANDMSDMSKYFPSVYLFNVFQFIKLILNLISAYIVLKRNYFSIYICYLIPFVHLFYNTSIYLSNDLYKNNIFLAIQEIVKITTSILIFIVIQRIIKTYKIKFYK